MREKIIKQYCHEVENSMDCDKRTKKRLITGLETELLDRGLPDGIDIETLSTLIGEPKDVAAELMSTVEIKTKPYGKKTFLAVIIALVLALCIWISAAIWASVETYNSIHGYDEIEIHVYPYDNTIGGP